MVTVVDDWWVREKNRQKSQSEQTVKSISKSIKVLKNSERYVLKFQSAYSNFWDCQMEQRPVFLAVLSHAWTPTSPLFLCRQQAKERFLLYNRQWRGWLWSIWLNDWENSLLTTSVWISYMSKNTCVLLSPPDETANTGKCWTWHLQQVSATR